MAELLPAKRRGIPADKRPLAVHVLYRFDTGGLENGVVNLINHMPTDGYRHAIVALTTITSFRERVKRSDVEYVALEKAPGHGFWLYPRLYRLFRRMKPAIVHSRNLGALEVQVAAWMAGVPVRIHGEHGRDVGDLDGSNRTYQRVRRLYRPFISHYVALSRDLAGYLTSKIGVPESNIAQIYNGVDLTRFIHHVGGVVAIDGCPFSPGDHWMVGTVGRMQTVKDQTSLARAFIRALEIRPSLRNNLRLVMVGEGPLRAQALALLEAAGVADLAWLPGERSDVPAVMRGLHCFVLPSLAEGISNTILEAMASRLPVIATAVGGNPELVVHGRTGEIVPANDSEALAQSMVRLASDPARAARMGQEGRAECEARFSLPAMVAAYQGLYDRQLGLAKSNQGLG
ncbi:sugar transferase [Rhodoferax koreense]|uniref:Sugar transferase n=1 Tax=Rhodoferax koreensis TaxID=1842727 RepID=A0A1P8K0F7_9BURK|nr:TIGR03088 family PEP-CTERM/XrtA system glycosyltransferase [Rhodoferax koreense]APW39493.1 sugar transferase [Rhodoferax koreense]